MNAPEAIDDETSFSRQQKDYLQGFAAGLAAIDALPFVGDDSAGKLTADAASGAPNLGEPATWFGWPLDEITREEQLKRERNPLDIWDTLARACAREQGARRAATSTGSSSSVCSRWHPRRTASWCACAFPATR